MTSMTEPRPTSLWSKVRANAVVQVVMAALLAGLAISRAAHGVVDAVDLVVVVAGASLVSASLGLVHGAFQGATDALDEPGGPVAEPARDDLFVAGRLWRRAAVITVLAALWSCAGAVVLAAVIGDRAVGYPVVAVSLAVLAGGAAVGVDALGRGIGARAAARWRLRRPAPVPLHRRAWIQIALPVGLTQLVAQVIISWVLFHDAGRAGAPALTSEAVLADALVVVTIIVGLVGSMAGVWGRLDARTGRVAPVDDATTPIGGQGLVLLGVTAVLLAGPAGWLVPADPTLARALLVRGILGGGLAVVAAGLGYVRGVHAAAAEQAGVARDHDDVPVDDGSPWEPQATAASGRPRRPAGRRLAAGVGATAMGLAAVALPGLTATSGATPLDDLGLFAEAEAFAVRVEYDIPLPAGTGSIPYVRGDVRRAAGEVAQGFAAAPTAFDAVVGGKYANPDEGTDGDESRLPNAECVAPGEKTDVSFRFPTDNRDDTAGIPPTAYATAHCGPGLSLELHARSGEIGGPDTATDPLGPVAVAPTGAGDLQIRTVDGRLDSGASARAAGVSVLGGLLTVDEVRASSATTLTGASDGAATDAHVDLLGVEVAGTRFDVRNGSVVVDGEAVGGAEVQPSDALAPAVDALAAQGCQLSVLGAPAHYPQGFLFSRDDPYTGMAEDGSAAGSMVGGLLLVCAIPDGVSEPTSFSPQRVQVLIGFAMSSALSSEDPTGFDLADLVSPAAPAATAPPAAPSTSPAPAVQTALPRTDTSPPTTAAAPPPAPSSPSASPELAAAPTVELRRIVAVNPFDDSPLVWAAALLVWVVLGQVGLGAVLTHTGARP